ncbi:MAG: hypothetical protein JWQ98_2171 [Chlorobi bacterium]|nr:hypothetical protein [Chlorobiota bacterium]
MIIDLIELLMILSNRTLRRLALLAFLLLPAVSAVTVAQEDIRLSTDPLQVAIPDDARIQSVGQVDSVRLAVWGSTRLDAAGTVVNTLYMQLLRDTAQLGQPRIVTSPDARPFGYVQVVSLADRFLVCWNDRRGGAYVLTVDTAGSVGAESLLWNGSLAGNIFPVPTGGGYRLMWNDRGDSSIHARRIDREGVPLEGELTYANGYLGAFQYPTRLPGLIILGQGNLPPIVLDGDGKNIPLGAAAAKLALPYYLGDDGDVVTIRNDTVREYRTILDSIPSRIFRVKLESGAISQTETVARDTAGRIQITYVVNGVPDYHPPSTLLDDPINRVVEQSPGEFGNPLHVATILVLYTPSGCYQFGIQGTGATFIRGCDNSYKILPHFIGWYMGYCHGGDISRNLDTILPYIITPERIIVRDYGSAPLADSLLPHDCGYDQIPVVRITSASDSRVRITIRGSVITCAAPAAILPINVPQLYPAVMNYRGTMLMNWLSFGFDSTAWLGIWNRREIPAVDSIDGMSIDGYLTTPPAGSGRNVSYASWRGNNQFMLSSHTAWTDTDKVARQKCAIYTATAEGWKQGESIFATDPLRRLSIISVFRNPDNNQTVIGSARVTANGWCVGVRALAIDSNGATAWRVDSTRMNPEVYLTVLPLTTNDFLAVEADGLLSVRGTTIDSVFFWYPDYNPVYARVFGTRFIRCYIRWGNLEAAIFDTLGHVVGLSRSIPIVVGGRDLHIVQNPADSGIVVLYGGKKGTMMMVFDKNLSSLQQNIPVSNHHDSTAHPVAAFRGDSLYVAWEDYRNGIADIYGQVVRVSTASLPSGTALENAGAGSGGIMSIVPEPVGSIMSMRLNGRGAAHRELVICDLYGAIVIKRGLDAGRDVLTVETGALPNGVYFARVNDGSRAVRFLVMH